MGDDEFEDDIDWAAVDLPPAVSQNNAPYQSNVHNQNGSVSQQQTAAVYNTNTNAYSAPAQPINVQNTSSTSTESLQQQIAHLQNLLQSKDSRIAELEASTAATSAAQQAEQEARSRIHLVEEELRRAKREADQYRGQWVRSKKRVAELESQDGRAITPSNVDHFHNHFKDDVKKDVLMEGEGKGKGVKRKSDESEIGRGQIEGTKSSALSLPVVTPQIVRYDSVNERVAKHLLLLDEMGCYSLGDVLKDCKVANANESPQTLDGGDEGEMPAEKGDDQDQIEQETKAFIKSMLCHMATGPKSTQNDTPSAVSVSGLVRILLERFNTLFYNCNSQEDSEMDIDEANTSKEQTMYLAITLNGKQVNYTTDSWRAVLYLLQVTHDVLNLSAKARDDLRWWFYQALQRDDDSDDVDMTGNDTAVKAHAYSRIEGLPIRNCKQDSKRDRFEAFWSVSCRSDTITDAWDTSTMTLPCTLFYEILVGLMKGPQNLSSKDQKIAQLKSIELVHCLMSDAPPHDQAEANSRNKTPYLWKFWFDSLFPLFSSSGTAQGLPDMFDFFSIWEKNGCSYRKNLVGSGRRQYTQIPSSAVESDAPPTKHGGGKQLSKADRVKYVNMSQQQQGSDQMIVDIKCKVLELMTYFISSSSTLRQSIFQVHNQSKAVSYGVSLAKRALFAVSDELDEFAIPFLSSTNSMEGHQSHLEHCLAMCSSSVAFLLMLSRSDAGIHLLRIQSKLDFDIGDISRWSASGIGCVTAVLDGALSHMAEFENMPPSTASSKINQMSHLKGTVENCISFYRNLLSFVNNQSNDRPKTKSISLRALIAENHSTTFVSCCTRITAMKSLSDDLRYEGRMLLEEVLLDDE